MGRTKKIGSAGRFGVRYGKRIRKRVSDIEKVQKSKHECPFCHKQTVKRASFGIWDCKKCNSRFAGKAYSPGD